MKTDCKSVVSRFGFSAASPTNVNSASSGGARPVALGAIVATGLPVLFAAVRGQESPTRSVREPGFGGNVPRIHGLPPRLFCPMRGDSALGGESRGDVSGSAVPQGPTGKRTGKPGQLVLHVLRATRRCGPGTAGSRSGGARRSPGWPAMGRLAQVIWHMVKHQQPYVVGGPPREKLRVQAGSR